MGPKLRDWEDRTQLRSVGLSVDRFGDVQLNVQAEELAQFGDRLALLVGDTSRTAVTVDRRADAGRGLGWWTDTLGMVAVIADGAPAADDLGVMAGDEVVLSPVGTDEDPGRGPHSTPVALGATDRGDGQGS